jgi:TolA-binding protein
MPFQPVSAGPSPTEKDLTYSRTVRAMVGQYIEIPFRGPGWVYLGEFGSRRGVRYDSRRIDDEGMIFVFRAEEEGSYSLRFNRQDFVRDFILNDYVKVIVEEPPQTAGPNPRIAPDRVYASPRWPLTTDPLGTAAPSSAANDAAVPAAATTTPAPTAAAPVPPAASSTGPTPPSAVPASAPETAQSAAVVPTEDWLKKAREEYNAGRIAGALSALDQFMLRYPGGSDEAYWLYGQALEANNETTRDIRLALDYYRRLVREYPQSTRYDDARQRIAYLERFYFNIQ